MLITILEMINPLLQFDLRFFASGSFLVGNTALVQAHTILDKAGACTIDPVGLLFGVRERQE